MENDNKALEMLETLATGVPAPVRKNFFKAVGQLCTAAVGVPVAALEGKAAEIKAISDARVQIIMANADAISSQLNVPKEYIEKASEKFASKIVKEQINLDKIVLNASNDLKVESPQLSQSEQNGTTEASTKGEYKTIDDDWLNEFENHAKLKSSDDMRLLFGKILSGEIRKPGSFSIKAIKIMSQLDNAAARLFRNFCSIATQLKVAEFNAILDARVISLNGNAAANTLAQFGLQFSDLNVLAEYGLIISDYNSYFPYHVNSLPIYYAGRYYRLIPMDEAHGGMLNVHGVCLTKAGKELLPIIPIQENTNYTNHLIGFFQANRVKMTVIV